MSDHTPGPWFVGDKRGVWVGPVVMADDGKRGVAFVVGESDANARLLAAAPDLLAALKAHIPWKLAGQPDEPPQGWGIWQDAIDAINKAEGRAT